MINAQSVAGVLGNPLRVLLSTNPISLKYATTVSSRFGAFGTRSRLNLLKPLATSLWFRLTTSRISWVAFFLTQPYLGHLKITNNSFCHMFLDLSGNLCLIFTYHPKLNIVHFHYKIILSHRHLLWRVVCHKMYPVRVTCIGTRCTFQMDMRLPIQGKYFGCSSEFSVCITTMINQGNPSVVPVLLKFVNDVFAKLKILHGYVTGETPKAMLCLPSPFPLQYEGMPSCPSLGARLCSCVFWLVPLMCTVHGHTYVHSWLSHLRARFTVTPTCTVHCHTYVHGSLSQLCAQLTVTLMCTVHCHTLQKYLSRKCHKIRKDHALWSVEW